MALHDPVFLDSSSDAANVRPHRRRRAAVHTAARDPLVWALIAAYGGLAAAFLLVLWVAYTTG
jgi:hypothetical protein